MNQNTEMLLLILLGFTVIVGVVATIAYYFARYGFKSDEKQELKEPTAAPAPELPSEALQPPTHRQPETQLQAPVEKLPEPEAEVTLTQALAKTKAGLWGRLRQLVGGATVSAEVRDQIEEVLYTSDLGVATVERLMDAVETAGGGDSERVRVQLKNEMLTILKQNGRHSTSVLAALGFDQVQDHPLVWLVVGVNGAGKTTTIGKLAYLLAQAGKKVLVAAGDTFRAAAGGQLKVWTERAQVEIFAPEGVADPAAVAYQALERGRGDGFDVVIIDTAGRLHTQKNLMEELKKVKRVLAKLSPQAPHGTLLVLDANSGQNAIVQAREFNEALALTGVILTKMDGTAKGGVALSLAVELNLPPQVIGVGEKVTDLRPFDPEEFVNAIL